MMKPVIQRPRNRPNHALPGVLAFLLFVACAALAAFYGTEPPAAVPPDAPEAEFSSGRAIEHARRVGREPHPTGSPENTNTLVLSAVVDGEPVEKAEEPGWGRWGLDLYAPPEDGVELTLELRPEAPVRLRVVGLSDGLLDVSGVDETRPPDTMPRFADTTAVGKSFDLTESGSGSGRNRP